MDERSEKILTRAMGVTLAIVYLLLFVSCIWKYVTTKDITNVTWELFLIVLIPASVLWFARKDETLLIPKMVITGEEVPTESNVESKKVRKRNYLLDSLSFVTIMLVLTILDSYFIQENWDYFNFLKGQSELINIVITFLIEFIISIVIFYIVIYVWGEYRLKRYNKKLEQLEEKDE